MEASRHFMKDFHKKYAFINDPPKYFQRCGWGDGYEQDPSTCLYDRIWIWQLLLCVWSGWWM